MQNLCSQVIARISLEKFCHNLNKKLITVTNNLEDSGREVNLSKNQEVGYLSSEIIPADAVDSKVK